MEQDLQALQINVSPAILARMRDRLRIPRAVLQGPSPDLQAA